MLTLLDELTTRVSPSGLSNLVVVVVGGGEPFHMLVVSPSLTIGSKSAPHKGGSHFQEHGIFR